MIIFPQRHLNAEQSCTRKEDFLSVSILFPIVSQVATESEEVGFYECTKALSVWGGISEKKTEIALWEAAVCVCGSRVAPPGKQLSPDSSLRSHTVVPFCICWLKVRKPKARFSLGLCGLNPLLPLPSDTRSETSKDDGNCNQQLSKYAGHFLSYCFWKDGITNSPTHFFPEPVKAKLSVKKCVELYQNPAEQPPASGIQTAANAGARKLLSCCSRKIKSCSLRLRVISGIQFDCESSYCLVKVLPHATEISSKSMRCSLK